MTSGASIQAPTAASGPAPWWIAATASPAKSPIPASARTNSAANNANIRRTNRPRIPRHDPPAGGQASFSGHHGGRCRGCSGHGHSGPRRNQGSAIL